MSTDKRWLVCVFTYNRLELLKNCVNSADQFLPCMDKLILDDESSDPRVYEYLWHLRSARKWWDFRIIKWTDRKRSYGGYFANQGWALAYALQEGYDYLLTIEDDMQVMWSDPNLESTVERVFQRCPDAIQLNPLFARRITHYADSTEYIQEAGAYRTNRGFNPVAIWNLDAVRRERFQVISGNGDDAPANSAWWLNRGYRLYGMRNPILAVVPWVGSRGVGGRDTAITGMPPMTDEDLRRMVNRHPSMMPYQEKYLNQSLVWHQAGHNLNRFYEKCAEVIREERRVGWAPVPVRVVTKQQDSTLGPLQSHLDWRPSDWKPRSRLVEKLAEWRRFSPKVWWAYRQLQRRVRDERLRLS